MIDVLRKIKSIREMTKIVDEDGDEDENSTY